ncbi:MAG: Hsp20/alpha crystallin family protein [Porphyromonadaceae bacterium]|nr:Hsp20/alpha crystallin family protein [Porphyromonadaceae bacterium]
MTLIRRNQNWIPNVFNDLFDNGWMPKTNSTAPAINVIEHKTNFLVEVAAPGMAKEDFTVRIDEDNNLVINMEQKTEEKFADPESRYLRREFGYSKFMQTILLPDNVDEQKISAKMENGVLQINIPKLTEEEIKKAQRQIEIS